MTDIRSFCNPYPPRFSESAQREKLTGVIYTGMDARPALILSVRKGSVVEVLWLFLLAKLQGQVRTRTNDLLEVADQIFARGGSICEVATGRVSNNRAAWAAMLVHAREDLGSSRRGMVTGRKNGSLSRGRPPLKNKMPAAAWIVCEREWLSRKHKTRAAAHSKINELLAVFGLSVKRSWLYTNVK